LFHQTSREAMLERFRIASNSRTSNGFESLQAFQPTLALYAALGT
jgi:hypothetical protein